MRREMLAGLALGAILGSIGFLRITSVVGVLRHLRRRTGCWSASRCRSSLVGVVLWGTLSGSLLPFLLRRLGFDPATSSAPFVATLVDVTGLVIYFSRRAVGAAGNVAVSCVRASGFRLRASGFRLRASGFRLQTTAFTLGWARYTRLEPEAQSL